MTTLACEMAIWSLFSALESEGYWLWSLEVMVMMTVGKGLKVWCNFLEKSRESRARRWNTECSYARVEQLR